MLVATENVKTRGALPGDQLGVQAKLHPNVTVLWQAVRHTYDETGPNYRAVLLPRPPKPYRYREIEFVAHELGCVFLHPNFYGSWACLRSIHLRYRMNYAKVVWVPPYKVEEGGRPSPTRVTRWKINAVLFCLQYRERMFTTRDCKNAGLSWTFFERFTKPVGKRAGRYKLYTLDPEVQTPDQKNPWLAKQIQEYLDAHGGDASGVHQLSK
jgi:hypothetical protein